MEESCPALDNLNELRQFVHLALCEQNDFEPGAFQFSERILVRGGRPVGLFFCLHGPRSVKLTAIWDADQNTIIFYSSTGERRSKARLGRRLPLVPSAA
ncbi:MAG TPA: hypothetical protein DCQ98_04520 [Planctomycetaceae bacterium]|nr:hypothetical protein [Planctomycetaceae bacterium]